MGVTHRTYFLASPLEPSEILRRAGALLSSEGVTFTSTPLGIVATRTPFVVLGVDPRLYTRKNWLGINPFTHVSGLDVTCERVDRTTNVIVRIDRTRALLFGAFWAACAFMAALASQNVGAVLLVVAIFVGLAWFRIAIIGGSLIARELEASLATTSRAA